MSQSINQPPGASRLFSLANIITLGSLSASLMLLTGAILGDFSQIGILFLIALFCDAMDGTVARMLRTSNMLGERLDSLVDMVSFGIMPPVVVSAFLSRNGIDANLLAMFIYLLCAGIRLGRFNNQQDKTVFLGPK